jgi:SAM-dependent methyltransferase
VRDASRFRGRRSGHPDRIGYAPHRYPQRFRVRPVPAAIDASWPEAPPIDRPFEAATPLAPAPITRYDAALFDQLNREYADHPIAPVAPRYDATSMADRSRRRIEVIHDQLDLRAKTVLEVGCGAGFEEWYLATMLRSDAWGIDISARRSWPALAGERVHLVVGDMAEPDVLPANTFDRVMSFTVWEHITRPIEAIEQLARVMKPGALAWIRANLYRGPTASHRTRDVFFPFPHLLFEDAVIDEALTRAGRHGGGSAWVNRLTWEQYEAAFVDAGLVIRSLSFSHYPLDEPFYARFEDVLGRYPRRDLERGFFQVVLEKPMRRETTAGS